MSSLESILPAAPTTPRPPAPDVSWMVRSIPMYQEKYGERVGEFTLHENHHTFPSIEKRDIARGFPGSWMTDHLRAALARDEVEINASSGTTAERMQIVRQRRWWGVENRRTYRFDRRLAAVNTDQHRKVVLTTAICSNTVCFASLPSYEQRILGQTLYLNIAQDPNTWRRDDVARMVEEINRYQPHILDVDPTYFAIFLHKRHQFGLTTPLHRPEIIIFTYELLTEYVRRVVARELPGVPTITFLGSTETGYNIFEHEDGRGYFHVQDQCYVDLVPLERDLYQLKYTSWKNEYMPLVNYLIGDTVRVAAHEAIPTERRGTRPLQIQQLCGRLFDSTRSLSGGLVVPGDIERAIGGLPNGIFHYQVKHYTPALCHFRYVTWDGAPLRDDERDALRGALLGVYGDGMDVAFTHERAIGPEASGKFTIAKRPA